LLDGSGRASSRFSVLENDELRGDIDARRTFVMNRPSFPTLVGALALAVADWMRGRRA
jgi:hypothetical protein